MVLDSLVTIVFIARFVCIVFSLGTFRMEVSLRQFQLHRLVVFRHWLGKSMLITMRISLY